MMVLVDAAGTSTFLATMLGGLAGAVVNFSLGRTWAFSATRGNLLTQAARYAFVSGTSAGLNALGVFALSPSGGVHAHVYVVARIALSLPVGLFWSFPMQRSVVFRERAESRA